MLEIEMKFPNADFATLRRTLRQWNAHGGRPIREEDHYFNAPDRDFSHTDEALRLRRVGPNTVLTYKGPKLGTTTKTRVEIESPLARGETSFVEFSRILTHLGYRPTAVVRKIRRLFTLQRGKFALEVCLDEVEDLGRFAELEIRAPESQLERARTVLLRTAEELGLTGEERRSYLELLLERRAGGETP